MSKNVIDAKVRFYVRAAKEAQLQMVLDQIATQKYRTPDLPAKTVELERWARGELERRQRSKTNGNHNK